MTNLSDGEREQVWRGLMRYWSKIRQAMSLLKTDLRAAINATDDWIEDNQSSYNTALPQAARDNLTAGQKTVLFCAVAARRVSVEFAKLLFGEVN